VVEEQEQTGELPSIPREVTPHGSRAAWGDLHVRFWWICAVAISIIMLVLGVDRGLAGSKEKTLIKHGVRVRAVITGMEGSHRVGYTLPRDDSLNVQLLARMPDGRQLSLEGVLPAGGPAIRIGQDLDIRVDPNDPSHWTDRTEMAGWGTELAIPLSLLPLIALLLALAMWRRRNVLMIWREGQPIDGIVVEIHQSAIAPLSRVVRYSIPANNDKRVFSALIPARAGVPAVGEVIDLLALPKSPDRSIVTKLYE